MVHIPVTSVSNTAQISQNTVIQKKKPKIRNIFTITFLGVVLISFGFLIFQNYTLSKQNKELENLLQSGIEKSTLTTKLLHQTKKSLTITTLDKDNLEQELNEQIELVNKITDQVVSLGGTLNFLDKLSKTDKELLQKYSKVFFLNEHYRPSGLSEIDKRYVYPDKDLWIHTQVLPHLEGMLKAASSSGVDLLVISAFRSFDEQARIKNSYTVTYGSGANQFSADQGYSEHQLGTTVDFTTSKTGVLFEEFEGTDAYKWLVDNAHVFGYVLSYPKNNDYYRFEPWHWRFVGRELATKLFQEKEYFYDMDQRDIDDYLAVFFD